jgi:hypothetical protein
LNHGGHSATDWGEQARFISAKKPPEGGLMWLHKTLPGARR